MKNKTQAVRLPLSISLPEGVTAVNIVRLGRSWVITPIGESWTQWFEGEAASQDFMNEQDQSAGQERASL